MVLIKGKILLLVSILVIASVTTAAYHVTSSNSQVGLANLQNQANSDYKKDTNTVNDASYNNINNNPNPNNNKKANTKKDTTSKSSVKASSVKTSDSQSIAQKYIEEPNAIAGKPEKVNIGGKNTDVVPVLSNGKRVGEIHIDPETGKNVGGAGGAP